MTSRSQSRPSCRCRWRWLLVLWLAGAWRAGVASPPMGEGEPFLQYFSPRDYNGGTQCLCMTQDARGVMYIGSLGLVLEYDGSTWRKINIDTNFASSIAYDAATDTVFVGAENDLGYLRLARDGERTFVSLLTRLPPDQRTVGTVDGVYVTPDGVFFVGTKQVVRWRGGVFRTWKVATASTLRSDWVAGQLYVYSPEAGFLRLENDSFVSASDDPLFQQVVVRSVVAVPGGALIGTLHDGLFTMRDGIVRPVEGNDSGFLKEKGVNKMLRLRDGSLAVATNKGGVLVLDPAGHFRNHIDQMGGLHGGNIFDLFEDAEGGLWIGLQSGISRAEVNSPLSVLRAGPDDDMSSAYCANLWFDTMVVGNDTGLYRVIPGDPTAMVSAHLERLPGTVRANTANCTVENGLLTITDSKIALLDAEAQLVPVADKINHARNICRSRVHPGRVYVVEAGGHISALRLDAEIHQWVIDGNVADLGVEGGEFDLAESPPGDLWVASKEHGVFRVQLAAGEPGIVTSFLDRSGPLQRERTALLCGQIGPVRFKGAHAVWGLDRSERELRTLTEFGERFCDGSFYLGGAMSYDEGSLWLTATDVNDPTGESLRGRAVAGSAGRPATFQPLPHKVEEVVGKVGTFHPVDMPPSPLKTILLVGTTGNGIVRMDVSQWNAQPAPRPFATLIRRAFTLHRAATSAGRLPILNEPLPYSRNSAHFEFAAGTLAYGAAPRFQTRLVGFGQGEWSEFGERDSVDYLNLPEGYYRFEVRARNADGVLGSVGTFAFRILPPWQRASWAYAAYALALALALYALLRWRGRQLYRRNTTLEALVDARTGELRAREADLLANERNLVRARDDAETANRAKSAFLANMSHELRTPLNAILGYTQIVLKRPDLPDPTREQVKVIGQSGGHLLSLINEVLDLSKIEAGKFVLSPVDFSLPQLLDEVSATFRPRFAEQGLTYTENRLPGLPSVVHTDPSRLRQVLLNLLSNAAKFTPRGAVGLEVRPAGAGHVRFEVTDTGVGIPAHQQDQIFLAFHQAGDGNLSSQGTGLGLAISQRLVGLLGGRIEVASAPGQGSLFWFELPLPPVESSLAQSAQELTVPALGPVVGYEGGTRRLLLVDDVRENRLVLREFLQPLGFEIDEAIDGEDCLAACERRLPHAVLLDLRLGPMDGFEVARTLRARTRGRPLGIVAISASVFESDRQQAIDAGCDAFLPKPFEEAQLLGTLGRVMGLRWVERSSTAAAPPPVAGATGEPPPPEEIDALLELSLRGDIAGLRRRLDALRMSPGGAALARRLDPLVATFDMDGIHALLLTLKSHAGR